MSEAGQRPFAAGAGRLAGRVCLLLDWSPGRFWHATPEELRAVLEAAGGASETTGAIDRRTIDAMMERERNG
ncbi:phage tail assembly chaperone [Novosphingobium huizhouense]|uniref:phage tail assembly chaperone n=1 Tax=Novosphingobium huizhouense TaxID=2866625 RepID=UPI001CD85CD3|nr:phage tail assembly chaperone [Novosphingobium huizhouense]